MAADMVQMNVRIPRALKVAGDEALASAGFSPSEVVRAVWEKAAKRGKDLAEVIGALRGCDGVSDAVSLPDDDPIIRAQKIVEEGLRELGVDVEHMEPSGLSYKELREAAYYDKMMERGLL